MALPRVLKNFNLFLDGVGFAGKAEEIKLPKLARQFEDYRAAGMAGAVKIDLGMQPLDLEFTLGEINDTVLQRFAEPDASGINLRFLGALVSEDGLGTTAVEISARGRWEEIDMGGAKHKDQTKQAVKAPLTYYKLTYGGVVLIEIDMISGKEMVNGVDRAADVMKAIGVTA